MATEIILNGVSVPFLGDTGIGINKKINAAPADIGSRSGNSTFTISIPGSTEQVRQLFNDLYDVNVSQADYDLYTPPRINTRLKAPVYIYQDMLLVFQGYARLNDIPQINGVITFQIVCYSELPDLFNSVGEKYLSDLDLSRFNHVYTVSNIGKSWDTSVQENGIAVPFELGNGYVYPMVEYGDNAGTNPKPSNWYWNNFKPAIYAKTILDQIFTDAGYMYTSAFFESEEFRRLIIPFTNGEFKISEDAVTAKQFRASRITTDYLGAITNSRVSSAPDAIKFNNEITDPSNQYDTASGLFTAADAGRFSFTGSITGRFKYINPTPFNLVGGSNQRFISCNVEVLHRNVAAGTTTVLATTVARTVGGTTPAFAGPSTINQNDLTTDFTIEFTTGPVLINQNDFVWIAPIRFPAISDIPNASLNIEVETGSYYLNQREAAITYGETIIIPETLPKDFKQKDFLAAMVKMHNLYFDDNPNLANTLIVEPRPQFYQDLSIDLTDKFDISKEYAIQPQGLSKYRSYLFSYQQDNDFYNEDYNKRTGEVYGQLRLGIANEFLGDEYKIDLPFAPTPLISQLPTDRAVSAIFFRDTSGKVVDKAAKPRILIYGGMLPTVNTWRFFDNAGGFTSLTDYPYAGHHDTPYQPTQDLLFFPPKFYYYGGAGNLEITITNQNLYNQYYYQHIAEIDSEDAATAKAFFNIQPGLFYQMGLRKLYFFQNAYWRILEIVDYSVSPPELTEIQFLKALEISAPPPVEKVINGGTGDWVPIPNEGDQPAPGLTLPPSQNGTGVYGVDNSVPASARNVLIVGNGITVGDETDGVVVLGGNSPVIESGIAGGLFLNVDFTDTSFLADNPQGAGLTAVSGETVYLGGTINVSGNIMFDKPIAFNSIILTSADSPYSAGDIGHIYCDTSGGNIVINLPTVESLNGRRKEYLIVKRAVSNTVTINAQGTSNIYFSDIQQTMSLPTINNKARLVFDGVNDWQDT